MHACTCVAPAAPRWRPPIRRALDLGPLERHQAAIRSVGAKEATHPGAVAQPRAEHAHLGAADDGAGEREVVRRDERRDEFEVKRVPALEIVAVQSDGDGGGEPKVGRGGEVHAMAVALRKVAGVVEASGGCAAPARSKPQRRGRRHVVVEVGAADDESDPAAVVASRGEDGGDHRRAVERERQGGAASRGSATGGGEAGRCPSLTFRLYARSAPAAGGRKEPRKARPVESARRSTLRPTTSGRTHTSHS